jgi:hypothetical protein
MIETTRALSDAHVAAALSQLRDRANDISDLRARQLVIDAIDWASANPQAITTHVEATIARRGHMPNMVAFAELMHAIEKCSTRWSMPVTAIIHDRQNEFASTMHDWHDLFSRAAEGAVRIPGGDEYTLRRAPGSALVFSASGDNAGIQCVDVLLWVFRRLLSGDRVGPQARQLLARAGKTATIRELSFEAAAFDVEQSLAAIFAMPFSDDELEGAKASLNESEGRRTRAMKEYERRKYFED